MERYKRLYSMANSIYQENSPIVIVASALLLDTKENNVIAQIKFENIGTKEIIGLKISLDCLDIGEKHLEGIQEFQYLDLSVPRGTEFGSKTPIVLPQNTTRSFSVSKCVVYFKDKSNWQSTDKWEKLEPAKKLTGSTELLKQYKLEFGKDADYVFEQFTDIWYCVCGSINKNVEDRCWNCHVKYTDLLNKDISYIESQKKIRLKHEKEVLEIKKREEQVEKARQEKIENVKKAVELQKKNKKIKKIRSASIILAILVLICGGVYISINIIYPKVYYSKAIKLLSEGSYDEALNKLNVVSRYLDVSSEIEKCKYNKGIELYNKKDYDQAIDTLKSIGISYEDTQKYLCYAYYEKALLCYRKKETKEAIDILQILHNNDTLSNNYEDLYYNVENTEIDIYMDVKEYEKALSVIKASQFEKIRTRRLDCVKKLAEQYIDNSQFTDCITLCLQEDYVHEEYKKACYENAMKEKKSESYKQAIEYFIRADDYSDAKKQINECKKLDEYNIAIRHMGNGSIDDAMSRFANLKGFENADKYYQWCKDVIDYTGTWECEKGYVYYEDGSTSDLSCNNDDYELKISAKISTNNEVKFEIEYESQQYVRDCNKPEGNILTYKTFPFGDSDISTFDYATNIRTVQYLNADNSASDKYVYTYKKIK